MQSIKNGNISLTHGAKKLHLKQTNKYNKYVNKISFHVIVTHFELHVPVALLRTTSKINAHDTIISMKTN